MDKTLERKALNLTKISFSKKILILTCIFGFFIGRITIFNSINPVAISYLSCLSFSGTVFGISLIFVFIGMLTKMSSFYFSKYIICICTLLILNLSIKKDSNKSILFKALCGSACIFISGISISVINDFSVYYTTLAVLESILTFSLTIILNKSLRIILKKGTQVLNTEEIISLIVLISSIISGSADIFLGSISFVYFFIILFMLVISYNLGGAFGGAAGVICSLFLSLTGDFSSDIVLIFCTSSIFSSFLRNKGKILTSVVFFITMYLTGFLLKFSILNTSLFYSSFISIIVFIITPFKILKNSDSAFLTKNKNLDYIEKLKSITINKLTNYSNSFEKLSKTFMKFSEKKLGLEQSDISNLIDDVASKVCSKCSLKKFCWEDNFYSTYQNIFSLLNNCENNGFVDTSKIPQDFIDNCINITSFIEILNKTFELYKLNILWNNRIVESRELVGQQLGCVSKIITELSEELNKNISFKEDISNKIKVELENNGIKAQNIVAIENNNGRIEVLLNVSPCYIPNGCSKSVIPIVENIVGKKLVRNCYDCIIKKQDNKNVCTITLIEEQKFRISTSIAMATKFSSKESGDSHSFLNLPNGSYLLALSDGMGSGNEAKAESATSIELFEDFITAGFSKDTALDMINSILFLKSSEENFSTLDVCTIDLYTGISEFIKIGAVSTFVIKKDRVHILKSSSLPVGILNNIEPEISKMRLEANDIIVMMTDGIIDSKNIVINKETWILQILENIKTKNTNEIAKTILEKAKENSKGKIKDDMTVLVARLWNGYD